MKRNYMTRGESYRLIDWVKANEADAKTKSYEQLAVMAQAALGFTITKGNMLGTVKELGIDRTKPKAIEQPGDMQHIAHALLCIADHLVFDLPNRAAVVAIAENQQRELLLTERA